jgi:hypothetical protein
VAQETAVIVSSKASAPAADVQMAAEVAEILDRRGALKHPPVGLVVSDAVALAIAGLFRSDSISGRLLERFYRTGSVDSDELLQAVEVEQAFASPEGHAALHCLAGWVRAQVYRRRDAPVG